MAVRAVCVLLTGLSPVLSLDDAVCGGIHCYGSSAYCCTDDRGDQSCCYSSPYEEFWFWVVLGIGSLLIVALFFCTCRKLYRYRNAGQYTKLRLQQPDTYGTISSAVANVSLAPPPANINGHFDGCGQLPTYAAVMSRPPAYSDQRPPTYGDQRPAAYRETSSDG